MLKASARAACSLRDLGTVAAELEGLLDVREGLLPALTREVFLASLDEGADQPADKILAAAVAPQVGGLGEVVRLVESAGLKGSLCLSDPQDQHRCAPVDRVAHTTIHQYT